MLCLTLLLVANRLSAINNSDTLTVGAGTYPSCVPIPGQTATLEEPVWWNSDIGLDTLAMEKSQNTCAALYKYREGYGILLSV